MGFYQYPVPLSGDDIEVVVKRYEGVLKLSGFVLANAKDFHNEIIESHVEMVKVAAKIDDKPTEVNVQTCHNLGISTSAKRTGDKLVLMIHGLGGNLTHYEPLISKLMKDDTPFLALDLPGFGGSSELDRYNVTDVAQLVVHLVQKMCNYHSIIVIGHSMGALLSIHISHTLQNKCACLILIAMPPLQNKALQSVVIRAILRLLWCYPAIFDFYRVHFDQNKGLNSSGIVKFYYRSGNVYGKLYQYYRNIQIKSKSLAGYLLGWQDVGQLPTEIPIHCIHGDKDEICSLQKVVACTKDAENVTLEVIEECSHNCLLDATTETMEAILKWI